MRRIHVALRVAELQVARAVMRHGRPLRFEAGERRGFTTLVYAEHTTTVLTGEVLNDDGLYDTFYTQLLDRLRAVYGASHDTGEDDSLCI